MWTVGKISQPDTPRKKWTLPTLTTFLPATPQLMDSATLSADALSVAVIDMQIASWICIMQMSGQTDKHTWWSRANNYSHSWTDGHAFSNFLLHCCTMQCIACMLTGLAAVEATHFGRSLKLSWSYTSPRFKAFRALDPANYRPISNLNTLSKILERVFLARLLPQVNKSSNFNIFQSAYRKFHSTETALLKILDDVYCNAGQLQSTLLIGLDLSAAFDTIDKSTLIARLRRSFGVEGLALDWISSYLANRSQHVRVGSSRSPPSVCEHGVPQGSVLGPILFSLYVAPVANVISAFNVSHHQYADECSSTLHLTTTTLATLTTYRHALQQSVAGSYSTVKCESFQ